MAMARVEFSLCLRHSGACAVTVKDVINGKYMEYMSVPYCTGARRKYYTLHNKGKIFEAMIDDLHVVNVSTGTNIVQ
jgi:hypothetical protein